MSTAARSFHLFPFPQVSHFPPLLDQIKTFKNHNQRWIFPSNKLQYPSSSTLLCLVLLSSPSMVSLSRCSLAPNLLPSVTICSVSFLLSYFTIKTSTSFYGEMSICCHTFLKVTLGLFSVFFFAPCSSSLSLFLFDWACSIEFYVSRNRTMIFVSPSSTLD